MFNCKPMEEKYFDFSKGLKAPYTIQVLKTPKGQIIWTFAQPIGLDYILSLVVFFLFFWFLFGAFPLPTFSLFQSNLAVSGLLAIFLARKYTEKEIDGKAPIQYLLGSFVYFKEWVLDKRVIYQMKRVEEIKEFSFKR